MTTRYPSSMSHSVDHGYAWVALASTSVMRSLIVGFRNSLGVIFVKWEESFGVTPAETSLVGSIFVFMVLGMAPISSALFKKLEHRSGVVCAGTVAVVCLLATTFVNLFWHMYIIIAILGVTIGLCYQPAFSFFVYFFDKYSATAHTLSGASAGIGILSFPPLMEYLITYYGWRGAFRITAAIMGHLCVCGLLLRSPAPEKSKTITSIKFSKSFDELTRATTTNPCILFLKDIASEFDLSLFYSVRFIFQTVIDGFLLGGYNGAIIYLVPYSVSVGISDRNSSFLMIAYGVATTLIRLTPVGLIVDKEIISAANMSSLNHLMMGLLIIVISFTRSYALLVLFAILFGILQGVGGCMFYVVVAQSAGSRHKGPAAIAWYLLFNGIGTTIAIYIVGILYDYTGSYRWPLILCGVCVFAVGINLLFDPILIRWQHHIEERRAKNSVQTDAY